MTKKQLSVAEIKAIAEGAITARQTATNAKTALEADPDNEDLKATHTKAESDAVAAEAKANALSQDSVEDSEKQRKIDKAKKKMGYIKKELQDLGELDEDEDDEDDEDEDDDDQPVTRGELRRRDAAAATQTAVQMADVILDVDDRKAVVEALKDVVPSGDPAKDFGKAVAIANAERNKVVLDEAARKVLGQTHRMGAGAPAKQAAGKFEPTATEAKFMKKFGLTQTDIEGARQAAQS